MYVYNVAVHDRAPPFFIRKLMLHVTMAFSTRVALVRVWLILLDVLSFSNSLPHLQVTGANQGIGFEIAGQLCREFDGKVLLAGMDSGHDAY